MQSPFPRYIIHAAPALTVNPARAKKTPQKKKKKKKKKKKTRGGGGGRKGGDFALGTLQPG